MKNIKLGFTLIVLYFLAMPAMAAKIYECVDEAGNTTYMDMCPPGSSPAGEKSFYTGSKKAESGSPDVPVTLYTVPGCDACDVVKNILNTYKASFTEKNIQDNVALQTELQAKSGGGSTLSVPTVIIGEKVIVGYNKQTLTSSLEEVGFKTGEEAGTNEQATPGAGEFSGAAAAPEATGSAETNIE